MSQFPLMDQPPGFARATARPLGLIVRWEEGQLRWVDPQTGDQVPTIQTERQGRAIAETDRDAEGRARIAAEQERDNGREARLNAEAQLRELEAELERRRDGA